MSYPYGTVLRPALDRFAEKIALADSGCIEWIAATQGAGYGAFYAGKRGAGETGKTSAHRWSYEYHVGPVPAGLQLDHLCRNRLCVNPDHLEPVTAQENLRRSEGNHKKTRCPVGHAYEGENLYLTPRGERQCRECKAAAFQRFKAKRSEKAGI